MVTTNPDFIKLKKEQRYNLARLGYNEDLEFKTKTTWINTIIQKFY